MNSKEAIIERLSERYTFIKEENECIHFRTPGFTGSTGFTVKIYKDWSIEIRVPVHQDITSQSILRVSQYLRYSRLAIDYKGNLILISDMGSYNDFKFDVRLSLMRRQQILVFDAREA